MTMSATIAHTVENATTRNASERGASIIAYGSFLIWRPGFASCVRLADPVSHAAHGFDHVDPHFPAQPADKDLYRVGITIEILIVKMLHQLRSRHHSAHVMHQIGKQPELMRSQLERNAI